MIDAILQSHNPLWIIGAMALVVGGTFAATWLSLRLARRRLERQLARLQIGHLNGETGEWLHMDALPFVIKTLQRIQAQGISDAPAEDTPPPTDDGYWTRTDAGGLAFHANDPASADD